MVTRDSRGYLRSTNGGMDMGWKTACDRPANGGSEKPASKTRHNFWRSSDVQRAAGWQQAKSHTLHNYRTKKASRNKKQLSGRLGGVPEPRTLRGVCR